MCVCVCVYVCVFVCLFVCLFVLKSSQVIHGSYKLKRLSEKEADNAKQEYQEFISSLYIEKKAEFLSFNMDSGRLDVFFGGYLHHNDKFSYMWKVCKVILMLSHGQADVERGFSINKEMFVDNMRQTSLIIKDSYLTICLLQELSLLTLLLVKIF